MGTETISSELNKAYEDLRGIDTSISTLSGRATRSADRGRGGIGRGGRGIGSRLGPMPVFENRRDDFVGNGNGEGFGLKRRVFSTDGDERGAGPMKRMRVSMPNPIAMDEFDDVGGDPDPPPPRRTLQSSVVMPVIETKSRQAAIEEAKTVEKKEQSVRNRRLFNNLLVGTLQKFRKEEKKVSSVEKVQADKQKEIEERLESKKREEKEKMERERNDLLEQRNKKEREIRLLQRKKAIVHYAEAKQAHYARLRNFIQTEARPPLFYLPGKHTFRTIELLKNSEKRIDNLITARKEQMDRDLAMVGTSTQSINPMEDGDEEEGNGPAAIKTTEERERDSGRPGRNRGEHKRDSEQEESDDDELAPVGELLKDDDQMNNLSPHSSPSRE